MRLSRGIFDLGPLPFSLRATVYTNRGGRHRGNAWSPLAIHFRPHVFLCSKARRPLTPNKISILWGVLTTREWD